MYICVFHKRLTLQGFTCNDRFGDDKKSWGGEVSAQISSGFGLQWRSLIPWEVTYLFHCGCSFHLNPMM